ncbi:plastocyanin/azurin family copper-binding protein, partial [Thermus scotoductus]|uniref:plastocyanin/azurin family copper-binding protein n=1 Tax=Thermus scotoductus TaxID=37636 RepID=UPI00100057FB
GSPHFENQDAAPHTATAEGGAFDTGTLSQGQTSARIVLNQPGTYPYFCRIHPGMQGEIEVR